MSASASGVAYSLGSTPNVPVDFGCTVVLCADATSAMSSSTRSKTTSKSTFWLSPSERVSCTTAIARDAAHGLPEGVAGDIGVGAARLDAQQRRHRLQVVLDPVVDLADRRVLGDQLALLVAELGHVAAQHDRADPLAAVADRDGAQRHRDAARLDVGAPRRAAGDDERQRLVDDELAVQQARGDLGERLPLELAGEAHAVERRQRVRARERGDAVDVEADETVGCARRATARAARGAEVGEVARRDHREQVVGALVEGELLAARRARLAEVRVPGDDRDRDSVAARCRSAQSRRSTGTARTRVGVSSYQSGAEESTMRARLERLGDLRLPLGLDLLAHEVAVEQRRRAGWPGVGDGDETRRRARHPQHDVGEGEVGEQLPVADEQVQPLDVGLAGAALRLDEITEGRHRPSVATRCGDRVARALPRRPAAQPVGRGAAWARTRTRAAAGSRHRQDAVERVLAERRAERAARRGVAQRAAVSIAASAARPSCGSSVGVGDAARTARASGAPARARRCRVRRCARGS